MLFRNRERERERRGRTYSFFSAKSLGVLNIIFMFICNYAKLSIISSK